MPDIPETDWKIWRSLAPVLLERFCANVVAEAGQFSASAGSGHEQFLALYRFIHDKNDDIRVVFDDRRRSNAVLQIAGALVRGIMTPAELAQFSPEFQERLRQLAELGG